MRGCLVCSPQGCLGDDCCCCECWSVRAREGVCAWLVSGAGVGLGVGSGALRELVWLVASALALVFGRLVHPWSWAGVKIRGYVPLWSSNVVRGILWAWLHPILRPLPIWGLSMVVPPPFLVSGARPCAPGFLGLQLAFRSPPGAPMRSGPPLF